MVVAVMVVEIVLSVGVADTTAFAVFKLMESVDAAHDGATHKIIKSRRLVLIETNIAPGKARRY